MNLDCNALLSACKQFNIEISPDKIKKFERYADLLVEWNQKMNLTAITSPEGIAVLHFADSLTLLSAVDIKKNAKMLDVGTGAGFPAIPVAIMRTDISQTLIDSLNKRLVFLDSVINELELSSKTVHARAEEAARKPEYRDNFDIVTARAVAPLNILCEYCLPFVKTGGLFAAMKGPSGEEELECSENAIKKLGSKIESIKEFTLPDTSRRKIILIRKVSQTPKQFPRQSAKISKSPL